LGDRKRTVRSVIYDQTLPYGENLLKIGLVDPEIVLLEGSLKRKKLKERN